MMRTRRRRLLVLGGATAAVVALVVLGLDSRLTIARYTVESEKIHSPVRLAVISDLHSCRYGNDMSELIEAIRKEQPDALLYTGDIFDDKMPNDNTMALIENLRGEYPSYYVTGNHEYWSGKSEKMIEIMKSNGVVVLEGEFETLNVNGQALVICGVDDPAVDAYTQDKQLFRSQLDAMGQSTTKEEFQVLLSHRPEYFDKYATLGLDLVVCGHAHGGQWRIPGFVNGLVAPNQGLFPKYAGGEYKAGDMTMIVSRGLARESTRIPRLFNRPELVIINLT